MSTLDLLLRSTRVPELRRRVLFTFGVLALHRLGVFITVPGVDRSVMQQVVHDQGGVLGMFNLFSGGALAQLSIFALGITPYITASIVLQLLGLLSKRVEELGKEGEAGRRKLEQWSRYATIAISAVQALTLASWLEGLNAEVGGARYYFAANAGEVQPLALLLLVAFFVACIALVVLFERAQRRIQAAHLPLKVNMASMIPPIFASSLLTFPQLLSSALPFVERFGAVLNRGDWIFNTLFAGLTIFFTFFYTRRSPSSRWRWRTI